MATLFPAEFGNAGASLEDEVAVLERKLAALISHTRGLRAANEALRRELAAAQSRNRALAERVIEAKARLDALMAKLPEGAE